MNKFKKKASVILLTASSLFTFNVLAANEPIYECSNEETASFIKNSNFALSLPSNVPTNEELNNAFMEKKAEEGDLECLAIFDGNFSLGDEWQKLLEQLQSIDINFTSLNGAILKALEKAYEQISEKIMEELSKGVCERIEESQIEQIAKDIAQKKIKDQTGIDIKDFGNSIKKLSEKELDNKLKEMYGEDRKYFYNPDKISDDMKRDAERKVKEKNDDFWEKI